MSGVIDRGQPGSGPAGRADTVLMQAWNDREAAMIHELLSTYGIRVEVLALHPHRLLPVSVEGLGELRILVPAREQVRARALIAEHRRQGLELLRGGAAPERPARAGRG